MTQKEIHISDAEMEVLASTAAMGNLTLEEVMGTAAWMFAQQDEGFKVYYLRKIWLLSNTSLPGMPPRRHGQKERFQTWHIVVVPCSVKQLLPRKGREDFSPVQKLAAAIQLFTTLPRDERLQLAREYIASSYAEEPVEG